ncbi:MAG: FAD-dependent oxidoreductase [Vulcanimicrobiaceae bacterium]
MNSSNDLHMSCCIVGGGPAGMMLGFLLARAGVEVAVLEKHGDFLRDFRGDTIHPSTLQIMQELGLLDEFLKHKHSEVRDFTMRFEGVEYPIADFRYIPTTCKFLAFMPQWDFLDFLAERGAAFPQFHLLMNTAATELLRANGRVSGVRARGPNGDFDITSALVVGADGRHSTIRAAAQFSQTAAGAPIDVLWMRVTRRPGDPAAVLGNFAGGTVFFMLNRDEFWQCAYIIPKGTLDSLKEAGIESVRAKIAACVPYMADRLGEIASWDDLKLLTVKVDRLPRWYGDGVLCIGDAAHAMSPIGGVGINLAVQDAVAAANILAEPLARGTLKNDDLARVQRRRTFPMRVIQFLQVAIQNGILSPALAGKRVKPPFAFGLLRRFPVLRRLPAFLIGIGPRPEHVRSPNAHPDAPRAA